jgi:hypothetical protein
MHTIKKHTDAVVVASKEISLKLNVEKISTWPYLEIRMQDKVTT